MTVSKDDLLRLADKYADERRYAANWSATIDARAALSAAIDSFASQVRNDAVHEATVIAMNAPIDVSHAFTKESKAMALSIANRIRALAPAGKGST